MRRPVNPGDSILITGGAGFIGANLAHSFLSEGSNVHIFDNLSRDGVSANVEELQREFPHLLRFTPGDLRDTSLVTAAVSQASAVFHMGAQVAVTTSLEHPLADMHVNLLGTLNVLEAVRNTRRRPPLLFTSTNKVYGRLRPATFRLQDDCWQPCEPQFKQGVSELQPLEFLSPYGCSKGSADQYVLDYARSFGIDAAVFRMSCIFGPRQLGSEDQGWVAHFLRQSMKGQPVTIFGDGNQVRDLLFIADLIEAMRLAIHNMKIVSGEAFNLGGSTAHSTSLLELLARIGQITGRKPAVKMAPERLADQKWYVADIGKVKRMLGWSPRTSIDDGLRQLYAWYQERPHLVTPIPARQAVGAGV